MKIKRLSRPARERQILDKALAIFVEQGYQGTGMDHIANAVGVSRPVIYDHFSSKDAVYLACLREARLCLDAALFDSHSDSAPPHEQLLAAMRGYFLFAVNEPLSWRLLYESGNAVAGPASVEARHLRRQTVAKLADMIRAWRPHADDVEIMAFAHALSGAGEQLSKWQSESEVDSDRVVSAFLRFAWTGLESLLPRSPERRD